jgi:hypothetical protein
MSLTVTANHNPFLDGRAPTQIVLDWIAAVDGTVSTAMCATYAAKNLSDAGGNTSALQPAKVRGIIQSIQTAPGLNGDLTTSLPTAYDLTLLDKYGYDVAETKLMGRSAAVSENVEYPHKKVIDSELTVTIANAGNGTKGRIIINLSESEDRP